jgi:hypothetical protein
LRGILKLTYTRRPLLAEEVAKNAVWMLQQPEKISIKALDVVPSAQRSLSVFDRQWSERRLWTSLNCTLGQSVNFFDDTSTLAYEADKLIHVPIPCDISVHQWKDVADTQSVTQTRAHVMRRME